MAADPKDLVTFHLDGREVTAERGEVIISAAERAGTYIPRFCYHPRMKPVGVCRMCLVEVEGPRGATLQPACFMPVTEGMVVTTSNDKVQKAQDGVLEFLLANHPLDCPVCDKGGECPLQDQTLAYGPGESRFIEEKRHFEKPIPISELVLLDRERCIQCSRCTRFAEEVAGEAQIDFAGRGDNVEVATFPGEPFSSYFSGNTVQICPVGALTATPYRFVARPWDLEQAESTCTGCSVGCRVAVQSTTNRLTRVLGIDGEVSHGWLCDKGRFGFEAVSGSHAGESTEPARITEPMVRRNGELVAVSWNEALDAAAAGLKAAGATTAVLGGAQFTNEGAYAWAKLAKGVLGTDSVDAQLGDGLDPKVVLGLPQGTMEDLDAASCVLTITGDLREELPVLFLRLRGRILDGLKLIELRNAPDALSDLAHASLPLRPGDAPAVVRAVLGDDAPLVQLKNHPEGPTFTPAQLDAARAVLPEGGRGLVVLISRSSLAESPVFVEAAATLLARALPEAKFLVGLRRANVRGALEMGMAPGLLPGRQQLDDARSHFAGTWPTVPSTAGHHAVEILEHLGTGGHGALVLLGADPLTDAPDAALATRGLAEASFVVAVSGHHTPSITHADVVLPVTVAHERAGTTTNVEGRVSLLAPAIVGPSQAWADWMIAVALGDALGADLGFTSLTGVQQELAGLVETFRGVTTSLLESAAGDGVVVPIGAAPIVGPSPLDPMAFPGVQQHRVEMADGLTEAAAWTASPTTSSSPLLVGVATDVVAPQPDGYALRLVAQRRLFDHGTTVGASPSLAQLTEHLEAHVNPYDLDRIGAKGGDKVKLRTSRDQLVVPVVADASVARGTIVAGFNLRLADGTDGVGALLDATKVVTDVRMESL